MVSSGLEVDADLSGGLLDKLHGAIAQLSLSVGSLGRAVDADRAERYRVNQALYTIPDIQVGQITAASGAASLSKLPDVAGPKTGQMWFITRLSVSGMTAGSVNVMYVNENAPIVDTVFFSSTAPMTHLYGGTQFPVRPGQWLVFQAGSGFTGTATISLGVTNVAAQYEGLYLL